MAVVMEAFSIREYTSRMRSVDLVKCWPFDEGASEEEMKAILGPIRIKKFRWWFDELQSDEESESLASIIMRRRRKSCQLQLPSKAKTPKKRSIVELFAVAPQVEMVVSSTDEDEEESGSGKIESFHEKSNKKDYGMQKKLKKKKKRGIGMTIKEMSSKLKLAPCVNSTAHSDGSTLSKGIFDNLSIPLKKQKLNTLATDDEAKNKAKTTSKLTAKSHKPDFPWHGVLKSYSETCRPVNKTCLHKIQNLNKHFALSFKDNELEPKSTQMELEFFKHSHLKGMSFQPTREAEEETTNRNGHHARINVQPPAEKQFPLRCHVSGDVDERFEDYNELTLRPPWLDRVSPKEVMHTTCCIPNHYQRSKVKMHHEERGIDEDFFCLPLNSQGELIRLSSNENGGLYQLGGSSVVIGPNRNISSESLINKPYNGSSKEVTSLINQLELCDITDYDPMPSRLCLMGHCHYKGTNALSESVHPFPLESRFHPMKMPNVTSRQDGRYGTYLRSEIIQNCSPNPTMRLMGQEFRIDGRRFQGPEGREFFKDQQIITEVGDGIAANRCLIKTQFLPETIGHPILGRQRRGGMHLPDYYYNQASGYLSHVIPPESTIFPPTLMQPNVNEFGKGCSTLPEMYRRFPVTANFHSDCHTISPLSENVSPYSYLKGYHSLLSTPMFHDTRKNTSRSCFQLENKDIPLPGGRLPFEFPFPHSEFRGHIQPSWYERSYEVTPPRFLEVSGRPDSVHPPWHVSRINHDRYPSVYLTPELSKLPAHPAFQNNSASASVHHTPLVSVHSFSLQDHAGYEKEMKNAKQVNPIVTGRTLSHGNGTKKRMVPASSRYNKSLKMPKFGSQKDYHLVVPIAATSPNLKWNVQYYHGQGSESASDKYKGNAIECDGYTVNMNEPRISSGKDSSNKVQSPSDTIPVKLTTGASHHEAMSKEITDEHSSICSNSSEGCSHM